MATIRKAAAQFDIVAIDSRCKVGVKQEEFDWLPNDFPNGFFLNIFQSNTAGTARGSSMAKHYVVTMVQVKKVSIAVCEKNRYTGEELQYLVFEKQISPK